MPEIENPMLLIIVGKYKPVVIDAEGVRPGEAAVEFPAIRIAVVLPSYLVVIAVDILPNSTSYAAPNIVLLGSVGGSESLGVKKVVCV
jgi:hypothetical protein